MKPREVARMDGKKLANKLILANLQKKEKGKTKNKAKVWLQQLTKV